MGKVNEFPPSLRSVLRKDAVDNGLFRPRQFIVPWGLNQGYLEVFWRGDVFPPKRWTTRRVVFGDQIKDLADDWPLWHRDMPTGSDCATMAYNGLPVSKVQQLYELHIAHSSAA